MKAAATRAHNAAAIKKRVLEAHAVKEATKQAIGAKLAKVEAIASDTRGEANTRAVAATMAPKLREQIATKSEARSIRHRSRVCSHNDKRQCKSETIRREIARCAPLNPGPPSSTARAM